MSDAPIRTTTNRGTVLVGRSSLALAFVLALVVAAAPLHSSAEHTYDPEVVKAGVVAQLTRFVEWPANVGGPHPRVVDVVFLGASGVADALRGRNGTSLRVRTVERPADVGRPHVLFVARSRDDQLPAVLGTLGALPVLVIGDGPSAARRGASFGLRDDGSRVRLEVNRGALDRTRLRVSYHVLRLSTEVTP